MCRKLLPPVAKRLLPAVQSFPLLADSLYDRVDVWMRFIRVQSERITMFQRELVGRELPDGFEQFAWRGAGRHRENNIVHKFERPAMTPNPACLFDTLGFQVKIPIEHNRFREA